MKRHKDLFFSYKSAIKNIEAQLPQKFKTDISSLTVVAKVLANTAMPKSFKPNFAALKAPSSVDYPSIEPIHTKAFGNTDYLTEIQAQLDFNNRGQSQSFGRWFK